MVNKGENIEISPPLRFLIPSKYRPPPCPIRDTHPIYWHIPQKYI